MKKLILIALLFLFNTVLFAQSSKFVKYFETTSGYALTGATVYLVPQSNTYPTGALQCTAHATRTGMFYRENVPDGEYKIYIDLGGGALLYEEKIWIGENRISLIANAIASPGVTQKIMVSTGTGTADMGWNSSGNLISKLHLSTLTGTPTADGGNQFYLYNDAGTVRPALLPAAGGQKLIAFTDELGGIVPSASATGQMLYSADGSTWTILAPGSDTEVLTMSGSVPNWETPSIGSTTYLSLTDVDATSFSGSANRLVISNGSALDFNLTSSSDYAVDYIAFSRSDPGEPSFPYTENELWYDATAKKFKYVQDGYSTIYEITNTLDVLTRTNTDAFSPSADYHPATKKYVDDNVITGGIPAGVFTGKGKSLWGTGVGTYAAIGAPFDDQILFGNSAVSTGVNWLGGTKGELLIGSGTGFQKLAAGTNGYRLEADDTETLGVKWANPSAAGTYLGLGDTPTSYSGMAKKIVGVNAAEDGLYFMDEPEISSVKFTGIAVGGQYVMSYDSSPDRLIFTDATSTTHQIAYTTDVSGGGPTIVRKYSDETMMQFTTLQDDDVLDINLDPNSQYVIEATLFVTGSPDGDIRVNWSTDYTVDHTTVFDGLDTGCNASGIGSRKSDGAKTDNTMSATTVTFGLAGTSTYNIIPVYMRTNISTSSNTTEFVIQWGQSVANSTGTTVHEGSYMVVHKL